MTLAIGQLWAVGGITYRIDSMTGPDGCYPIVMLEVSRDPQVNREINARIAATHPSLVACTLLPQTLEPRTMHQEPRWFERTDVKRVTASAK